MSLFLYKASIRLNVHQVPTREIMRQPGQTGLIQFSLLEDHRSIKMPHLVFLVHCHHPSNPKIGRQLGENFLNKKVKSDSVFRTENQVPFFRCLAFYVDGFMKEITFSQLRQLSRLQYVTHLCNCFLFVLQEFIPLPQQA